MSITTAANAVLAGYGVSQQTSVLARDLGTEQAGMTVSVLAFA